MILDYAPLPSSWKSFWAKYRKPAIILCLTLAICSLVLLLLSGMSRNMLVNYDQHVIRNELQFYGLGLIHTDSTIRGGPRISTTQPGQWHSVGRSGVMFPTPPYRNVGWEYDRLMTCLAILDAENLPPDQKKSLADQAWAAASTGNRVKIEQIMIHSISSNPPPPTTRGAP